MKSKLGVSSECGKVRKCLKKGTNKNNFHFSYFCLTWTHALPMYAVIGTVRKGVMLKENALMI